MAVPETALPSQQADYERYEETYEALRTFAESHGGDPLCWIVLPVIAARATPAQPGERVAQEPLTEAQLERVKGRLPRLALGGKGRADHALHGDCVSAPMGTNARRALDPVFEHLGWESLPVEAPGPADSRKAKKLAKQAVPLAEELTAHLRDSGVELPVHSRRVYSWFIKAADNLASFREVISNVSPKLAAIASAHHPVARALVLAAREDGVPSVYVPHAPTIALRHLEDLPVDYVALRGQAEAELFAEHGADPARLTVGGNPSIEADEPPELDADGTPVLALSPFSDEMLGAMLEVAGAALEEAVVAPHPRLQPETLALPDGWTVWPERTYDLLKTGPPVLVQSSSGVALEALHLGVPTINLAFPGAVAYPFIREPEIPQVGTSGELSQAVERARRDAADIAARRELTAWAKRWSDPNGAPALERIGAIFTGAVADGPREAIWDHWSPA